MIIFLIYFFFIKRNIHFINNPNILHSTLVNYVNNLYKYKNELKFKTNTNLSNVSTSKIVSIYEQNILKWTKKEKEILFLIIENIQKKYHKYPFLIHNWNVVKVSDNIEHKMPFTLDKYIFLPQSLVNKVIFYNKNITTTLIHEKIHTIQRENPNMFESFYLNKLGCIKIKNLKLSNFWKRKHLINPDGIDINYIYKFKGTYYLPLITYKNNTKSIKKIVITLDKKSNYFETTQNYANINEFPVFSNYTSDISCYHPNEISAYVISKMIINPDKIKPEKNKYYEFDKFINDLKNIY